MRVVAVLQAGRSVAGAPRQALLCSFRSPTKIFPRFRARYGARATKRIWNLSRLASPAPAPYEHQETLLEQLSGSPSDDRELFAFGRSRRARLTQC